MRARSMLPSVLAFASLLPAQTQFAETNRSYLPIDRSFSFCVAAADFDGDGDQDLLFGNVTTTERPTARLYRNDGFGRFTDLTATKVPKLPVETYGIASGDLDGDGDIDVVLANHGQCRLWLNDGTGTFVDVTSSRLPTHRGDHIAVQLRDVDKDGDLDILIGSDVGQLQLYKNDGLGSFIDVTATNLPVLIANTEDLGLFDFDHDGDLDLVLANYQQQPRFYLNDGTGKFTDVTASRLPTAALATGAVAIVDVDGDGDMDLVFGSWHTSHVLYVNDGTGVFTNQSAVRFPSSTEPCWRVRAADLDKDGDMDLVFANVDHSQIYRNNGAGVFTDVSANWLDTEPDASPDVAIGDFDADGDLDLVFADYGEPKQLWFNDGTGQFASATQNRIPAANWEARAMASADVNGDGFVDLVLGIGGYDQAPTQLRLNDRLGSFVDVSRTHLPPAPAADIRGLAVADLTGDGHPDIVRGAINGQTTLWKNDGTAHFVDVTATHLPALVHATTAVVAVDVDHDGDRDLVLVGNMTASRLYLNDGTGKFTDATATRMPALVYEGRCCVAGDFDRDGDVDLVICGGSVALEITHFLANDGTGRFTDVSASHMPPYGLSVSALVALDADNDGDLDLVLAGDGFWITGYDILLLNDGSGHFSEPSYGHLLNGFERTLSVSTADVDGNGTADLLFGDYDGTMRLYLGDGTGYFTAAPERVPGDRANCLSSVLADVDGDGDADAITCGIGLDRLATVVLVNHERQLVAPWLAKLGTNYVLQCHARPGYGTGNQSAFVFVAAGLLPTPIQLAPFGAFRLDLASLVALGSVNIPVLGGFGQMQLAIPNQTALLGATLASQCLVLHSANPADARLTNALADRLVR